MSGELIPPVELAPPSVKHLTVEQRINLWADLVDQTEAFLLAGLRSRIGPSGDLKTAYREWYARYLADRERSQIQFLQNLSRREAGLGQ